MPQDRKRSKLEIIRDILEATRLKGPRAKPTHVLYKANLSYQLLNQYMADLKEKDLITEEQLDETKRAYSLTEKGYKYLHDYQVVSGLIDSYGLDDDED
ncbi:MAG: winged helix-turn-helix domain-containing protein [Candidatus Woesearchaeota archaeon]